jgi:hypothetical protein
VESCSVVENNSARHGVCGHSSTYPYHGRSGFQTRNSRKWLIGRENISKGAGESERPGRNRDRAKTLFGMVAALVVLPIAFLGVFSSSQSDSRREPPTSPAPPPPVSPTRESDALAKSSLVFVRSASPAPKAPLPPRAEPTFVEQRATGSLLPSGTRLLARLQTAVSTAVKTRWWR